MTPAKTKSISPASPKLPLLDTSHFGDCLVCWLNDQRYPRSLNNIISGGESLEGIIQGLQSIFQSASICGETLAEDELIDILFSQADVEFEQEAEPVDIPIAGNKTLRIRQTEVINNDTLEEQDVFPKPLLQSAPSPGNTYLNNPKLAQATLCCCSSFLDWLLERIGKKTYGVLTVGFPFEIIFSFVQDFSATGLVSGFCEKPVSRAKRSYSLPKLFELEKFALFNMLPENPDREIMAIFAIRQLLESWFMRIVGFRGIVPLEHIDIRSGRFQKIIGSNFSKALSFGSGSKPVTFASIQRIYQWAQAPIHWAYSTNIWLIWKALTYCERLMGATISLSSLEQYRKEVVRLCLEESKYTKRRKDMAANNIAKKRPDQRTIIFRSPDLIVKNDKNEMTGKTNGKTDMDENSFAMLDRNVVIRKTPVACSNPMGPVGNQGAVTGAKQGKS